MSCCHNTSVYLACSYQKTRWEKCPSHNFCLLIEVKEKRGKLSITLLTNATVHQHIQRPQVFLIMPKIPEISAGNGKVHFGFFWPEYSGSSLEDLEVVHLFLLDQSDWNFICCSVFDKPVHSPASLHLCRELVMKNGKSLIPLGWPGFIRRCHSIQSSGIGIMEAPHM